VKRLLLLTILVSCLAEPVSASAQELSPSELVERYERTLTAFSRASFTARTATYFNNDTSPANGPSNELVESIWRDGKRWKVVLRSTHRRVEKGKTITTRSANEEVYPGKGRYSLIIDPETGKAEGMLANLAELSADEQNRVAFASFGVGVSGVLMHTRYPLPEVLRKANKLTATRTTLEKKPCWLLEAQGEWGNHSLWLDPDRDFLPRRMVLVKENKARVYVSPGKIFTIATMPANFNGPWKRSVQQFDAARFELVGGRHLVTAWKLTREVTSINTTSRFWTDVVLSDINLNPNFTKDTFRLTTPVPDGMRVTVDEQRGIDFEWRDGKVVKKVNQAAAANLEGNLFRAGSGGWRNLLVGGGLVAAVLLLGGVWWYRRRLTGRPVA
jgi:hypothetical protein